MSALGVDLLTMVGHKMYAPKGVGALYVRSGTRLHPLIHGGGQEGGLRAGTENVALVAALGKAAELARLELPGSAVRLAALRDLLHAELEARLPGRVHLNGHPAERLPGTLNVSIDGVGGRALLAAVPGIAAATGSACHEGVDAPSPVLLAMGLPSRAGVRGGAAVPGPVEHRAGGAAGGEADRRSGRLKRHVHGRDQSARESPEYALRNRAWIAPWQEGDG
ncbi:cysteine desulfurase family protein [Nonomuraea ferruginea]